METNGCPEPLEYDTCCHGDSQDSVIYERMVDAGHADISRATEKHMEHFAVDGLRTLCIAERKLDESLYKVP